MGEVNVLSNSNSVDFTDFKNVLFYLTGIYQKIFSITGENVQHANVFVAQLRQSIQEWTKILLKTVFKKSEGIWSA